MRQESEILHVRDHEKIRTREAIEKAREAIEKTREAIEKTREAIGHEKML